MTKHKIIHGDSREMLKWIEPNSIDLVITSPPYWGLKDYGTDNQIGFQQDFENYMKDMNTV